MLHLLRLAASLQLLHPILKFGRKRRAENLVVSTAPPVLLLNRWNSHSLFPGNPGVCEGSLRDRDVLQSRVKSQVSDPTIRFVSHEPL